MEMFKAAQLFADNSSHMKVSWIKIYEKVPIIMPK